MKFECDSCHAQYMIADEKVGKRGVKVKCKKCQHVIIVRPDAKDASAPTAGSAAVAELPKLEPRNAPEPAVPAPAAVAPKMEASRKSEKTGERSSSKSSVKKAAKEKAAIELPVPTLAAPPPPGLDLTAPPDDGADAFAAGGATDPSAPSMQPPRAAPVEAAPPPPPPASDEGPEATGPNLGRPAPISMFQDQTQLTQNPMGNMVSEPEGKRLEDKTELGGPNAMSLGNPGNGGDGAFDAATQVTKSPLRAREDRNDLEDVPAPPPPPAPPPGLDAGAATMPAMPAMPSMPAVTAPTSNVDELGDVLSGAFNAMFDAAPEGGADGAGEDQRASTRVIDASVADALRKQSGLPAGLPSGIKVDNTVRGEDHGLSDEGFVIKPSASASGADDGPPDQVWHVAIDDQDVGPLSLAEVGRHIEGGRVDRESLVWKIGMDDWLPAGDIPAVRALFDKVPMPRIARVEDEGKSNGNGKGKKGIGEFPELDDSPTGGGSPFDDSDDASWRPHGLTDVYQAANLAEAAGAGMGMGGSLGAASFGMSASASAASSSNPAKSSPPVPSEPEWRPAAASALSALVNDEIKRIDNGPPPAADNDLSPADDASINAPIFGSMGGGGLDAGPELSDPSAMAPPRVAGASFDGRSAPLGSPSFPAQPAGGGFMSTPPQQQRMSPALMAGIAGGGALLLVLVILIVVLATKGGDEPANKVVMIDGKAFLQSPDGKFTPLAPEAKKDDVKEPVKDEPPVKAAPVPPVDVGATPPADAPPADVKADAPPVDKPDVKKVVKPRDRDPPSKRDDKPPPPPKDDKPPVNGKCDPILDFDCKAGSPSASSAASKEVKETLSKSDVLVVVKANMKKVEGCGGKHKVGGVIKMSWKIQPSGKVGDVQVADSKFAGTPVGGCVTNEIKNWKFPASKAATPVSFPMKLGG